MMYQIYSRSFGTTIHWIPDDRGFALDGALWRLDLVLPACVCFGFIQKGSGPDRQAKNKEKWG
jgi:hypothetical protein